MTQFTDIIAQTTDVILTHDDPVFKGEERFIARFRLFHEASAVAEMFSKTQPGSFYVTDMRKSRTNLDRAPVRVTYTEGKAA